MIPVNPSPRLEGSNAIIMGGTTGVGRATARLLARQGCRVFICGRDRTHLADALREVREDGGVAEGMSIDVGEPEGVPRFFEGAEAFLGAPDFVILTAGVGSKGELADMTHEECREVVAINLVSYLTGSLEAIRRMRGRGGHLVMTGSLSAEVFDTRASVYVATKSGLRGFAASLRKEANPLGIKVSLLEPGTISSDMVDESDEEQARMIAEMRMLRAEDVAEAILFIITRAPGCDIITMQLRPHLQLI